MTIVVGAGLAGLTCARVLAGAGRPVTVLDAAPAVGGRARSERCDGFITDVGFQVLFTAYPTARRHLDFERLDLRAFDQGAIICRGARRARLLDPRRHPGGLLSTIVSPALTPADKARLLVLAADLARQPVAALWHAPDRTALDELRARGLSERFIANVARPFLGGIFLDRTLSMSARPFLIAMKMLSEGVAAVPAAGMGALASQLAASVPPGQLRLGVRVVALLREGERVVGVRTDNGGELRADQVVIATDHVAAAALTGLPLPTDGVGVTQVCFATAVSLYPERLLLLNADPAAFVNDAVQISTIAPEYAPAGEHLLSCTVLGRAHLTDDAIIAGCRTDLSRWFGPGPVSQLRPLVVRRIAHAQSWQPPGYRERRPNNATGVPGLWLAGDYTETSSIDGAMASGEQAARCLLTVSSPA